MSLFPLDSFSFSFSFSFSRSSFMGLAVRRLNHRLGLRSNSFDDRSSSLSFSPPLSLSLSLSCSFVSLPLRYCRGTAGTGGSVSSAALRVETVPSDVEGRALEPLDELRNVLNNPPCARPETAVGVFNESGAGMRIEGRDFFRDGSATEATSGVVTREGEDGAVSIGGCGDGSAAGEVAGDSPRPGGSAGSGSSNDDIPFVVVA